MNTKLLIITLLMTIIINAQWTEQVTGFTTPSRGINFISIVDSNTVWASAYDGSGDNINTSNYTKTLDGGSNWTPGQLSGDTNLRIAMIYGVSSDKAWGVAYRNSGTFRVGVYATTDGGSSWGKQSTATFDSSGSFPNVVHFWDENIGFCQGDPVGGYYELYTTTNGGTNWVRVPQANIPAPTSGEFGYVGQIYSSTGNRIWWTTNSGRIFRSDDNGLNWIVFQSPLADFGGAEISFWDDSNGMLINTDGILFSTSDGGETWSTPIFPNSGEVFGSDISCVPGTNIIVSSGASHVVGSTDRGSSFSNNGGLDWTTLDIGNHIDVAFKDVNTGWSAGFNADATTGGIFKYTGTELTAAVNDNTLNTFTAYPNPVENIITIEANDTITNAEIFNVLGQSVFKTDSNQNTLDIDMSNFTSGTYILKVTINETVQTMKLVK